MGRSLAASVAAVLLLVAGCGADVAGPDEPTFRYVIPAGTGERTDRGERIDILPGELVAQLDDTIVITNEDDEAHFLGPWFVGPGETLRQRFTEVGVFDGTCSVHPSGEFTVIVEA